MRARNIKPGFYRNADLAECSVWARLVFPGLWMLADREGRLIDRPKQIKGELLPYDSVEVEPLLRELAARGFIKRYEVDGQRLIEIPAFRSHQSPHYSEKASGIKPPPIAESRPPISGQDSEAAHPMKGADSENVAPINGAPFHRITPTGPPLRGGRNPLNPESRILNPDSPNPEAPTVGRNSEEPPGAGTPAGRLSRALRSAGIASQPLDPRLIALAAAGITPEQMAAAAAQAREVKGDGQRIPAAYVYAIAERWLAEPSSVPALAYDPAAAAAAAVRMAEQREARDAKARTA